MTTSEPFARLSTYNKWCVINTMTKPMKITVIEPDVIAFHIIRRCFDLAGHAADWRHIRTGREALAYLENGEPFDYLFIEPVLPDMAPGSIVDAIQTSLRADKGRVCLLSTIGPEDMKELRIDYPFLQVFSKPFRPAYAGQLYTWHGSCDNDDKLFLCPSIGRRCLRRGAGSF